MSLLNCLRLPNLSTVERNTVHNGLVVAATRLASGIYKTNVGDGDVSDGATVDPIGGELARLNDMTVKVEPNLSTVERNTVHNGLVVGERFCVTGT